MDFKRYFGKIQDRNKEEKPVIAEEKSEVVEEVDTNIKKTLDFVNIKKDPHEYILRYLKEQK